MTESDSLTGQTIGRYRIRRHMARGGMADVYLADDVDLQRQVVLKIMLPHLAHDEQFVLRFQREGQATARLNHPNIVQVYSTGLTSDGRPYLAMQYVQGGALHTRLAQLAEQGEMLSTVAALTLTRQIADALRAANHAGIIHRDLKPSNILLHRDGAPVVTDLGIAAYAGATRLTQTGNVMGTPHYMSPEQAQGKPLDGRSDIYSLGVILHEFLTGSPPFQATSPLAVLHQHIYEAPPPLHALRPDLKRETLALVDRALRKDPEERFQDAGAMVLALDGALVAEGGNARFPKSSAEQQAIMQQRLGRATALESTMIDAPATPADKSNRRWLWAVPLALLLLVAVIFLLQRPLRFTSASSGSAATVTLSAIAADTATPEATIEETAVPATATLAATEAPSPTATSQPTATPSLAGAFSDHIVFQSNRDGDFDIYIMDAFGRNQRALTVNGADDNYPVVSPDGTRILYESDRDGNAEVYVMDVDGGNQQRLTNHPARDLVPTWSPDGRQIAFASDRDGALNIYVMDADGNNVRQLTFDDSITGHPTWSVNDEIAFNAGEMAGNTWEIYVVDVNGGNRRQLTDNQVSDWSPEWSPDGRSILYLSSISKADEAAIYVMNADGSNQRLLHTTPDYEWGADWSADGQCVVFTREQGGFSYVYVMNADGSDVTLVAERAGYPSWVK